MFIPIGDDFSDVNLTITIPATEDKFNGIFVVPDDETFTVTDDGLYEIQESFALVAQLGDNVPDSFTCFQRVVDDTECFGRTGVTEITIFGMLHGTHYNVEGCRDGSAKSVETRKHPCCK